MDDTPSADPVPTDERTIDAGAAAERSGEASSSPETRYLARPQGRVAYDVTGQGPLLVLVPGMGDLRSSYRFVAPALATAGYRVATMDLRGHGDSDATFSSYGDSETATDVASLIAELGRPAVVVGNSMAAAAGVLAAVDQPDLVAGLVLIGPFVRDPAAGRLTTVALRVAMAPWWAPMVWRSYLPRLYAGRRPADFEAQRQRVVASLRRPGYARAFSRTTHSSHRRAETVLEQVGAPTLIVMGELDADFADPAAEATWIAERVGGQVAMVAEAGHYPQAQRPELVVDAMTQFLDGLGLRA